MPLGDTGTDLQPTSKTKSPFTTNWKKKESKKCRVCKAPLIIMDTSGKVSMIQEMNSLKFGISPTRICQTCQKKKQNQKNLSQAQKNFLKNSNTGQSNLVKNGGLSRKQKLKERKERKKLKHLMSQVGRKKLKKKAETLFHLWIRRKATRETGSAQCYSCYALKPFSELEAGHRHHNRLDLDERNLKVQCTRCNHYLSGNAGEYERHLIEDYGLAWAQQLKKDADTPELSNYTYDFLVATIEELTLKLKEL